MRPLTAVALMLCVLAAFGQAEAGTCRNCGLVFEGDGVYCADCARRFEAERERAAKELIYVEAVVKARRDYERAADELVHYYLTEGDVHKLAEARNELQDLQKVRKYDYIFLAELLSPDLSPKRSIAEAETLFRDGLNYYRQFAWPWQKADRYRSAILKFTELIRKHPESDRIDDAAYYLGRCYEKKSIGEYRRAVAWYERAYNWNPQNEHDLCYRIARIYDYKLGHRDKALVYYHLVVRDSGDRALVERAQRRIGTLQKSALDERQAAVTPPEPDRRP